MNMDAETPLVAWVLKSLGLSSNTKVITRSPSYDDKPTAMVIPPSEYFEGNDGQWSTFNLRVGTPEQDVRVIVSTASPESFVVLSEYGCSTSVLETVPPNCAVSRGNLFNPNESSSWYELGLFGINEDGVGLEANLGYSLRAEFGTENLGLGLTGPSLENQTVAGIAAAEPFYLGLFGLNNQPVNFTSLGNFSSPSFLTTLKDQDLIPSLSWSYTAGAQYRLKQVYGQLILSGYDTSRFIENSASFTMAGDVTPIVVQLQKPFRTEPIDIFIDSTDPRLWLPEHVCDAFEEAFGITLDSTTGLYLVNETHHSTLLNSDAEVTFRLSDVRSGGEAVKIVLPYAAFDLTARYPLVENKSYYFPLKRVTNSTQYILGRTFLQEAYLTADYERGVFNVSACSWVAGAEENVVVIPPKDSCSSINGCSSSSGNKSLSGGETAGIVIGVVLATILVIATIIYLIRRERKKKSYAAQGPAPDMAVITGPVHNHHSSRRTGKYYSPDTVGTSTDAGYSEDNRETYVGSNNGDSGEQELDEQDTQIEQIATSNRDESHVHQLHREAKSPNRGLVPIYYELGGRELTRTDLDSVPNSGALPSRIKRQEGEDHLSSPFVSTLGSVGWQGEGEEASSDLVSPTTPIRHSS
ncbi:aspartic peptidase domain-containing protein [Xylaria digitata]|nr:aspartic peptidase domain-containing protein [Xylaria digitata]